VSGASHHSVSPMLLTPGPGREVCVGDVVVRLTPGVEVKTSLYCATTAVACEGILSKEVCALVFVMNTKRWLSKSYKFR
jgi:hypothetical protein